MPKVTEAHVQARRSQILQAACKCFSKYGFHKSTVREICEGAGLSAGAVYGYFKSKDEILEALAGLGRQSTRALLDAARTDAGPVRTLSNLMASVISCLDSEAGAEGARLDLRLWDEGLSTPRIRELFIEAHTQIKEPFSELVRAGQQSGELASDVDPAGAAQVLVALSLGLTVLKAMEPDVDLAGASRAASALISGRFAAAG